MYSLVSPNNFCKNSSEGTESVVQVRVDRPIISLPKRGSFLPGGRMGVRVCTLEKFDANRALLIMFLCDHCPYVEHLRQEIVKLASCYMEKGLGVLAITSCHDGTYFLSERPSCFNYPFPYWFDIAQNLAKALSAVGTPEFFLFKEDDDGESFVLEYHGQFDDSRPDNDVPVTGRDLRIAIDCVLNGLPVPSDQKPGFGCNFGCTLKWHSHTTEESEPDRVLSTPQSAPNFCAHVYPFGVKKYVFGAIVLIILIYIYIYNYILIY